MAVRRVMSVTMTRHHGGAGDAHRVDELFHGGVPCHRRHGFVDMSDVRMGDA
jgi:hypothetical protein